MPDLSNTLRWLAGGIFLPLMLPLLLYRIIFSWNYVTRQRAKLENKVVLITGASSGLGEALAEEFYKAGCKVILASRRLEELEKVKTKLINLRSQDALPEHQPAIIQIDLTDLKSLPQKAKEALKCFDRIDILVNNAGISYRGEVESTMLDVDIKVMAVNYFGQIALTKSILPEMVKNNFGHIVFIGSVQGKIAIPYRSAYAASKHALQAFCDSLRAEIKEKPVKVTIANPGYIKTSLSFNAMTGDGSNYGEMDQTTATGMEPMSAAKKILEAIILEKEEIFVCGLIPLFAVYIRLLCPQLYFLLMKKRALKQDQKIENSKKSQ